jgi:hypothetical protein
VDPQLASNVNFASSDSLKLLITHSGVAELRAILQYQLMHKQALIVACRTNQALVDVHQRALMEIDVLAKKRGILPNSAYSIDKFIKRGGNDIDDTQVSKRQKLVQSNLSSGAGPIVLSVRGMKSPSRGKYAAVIKEMRTGVDSRHRLDAVRARVMRVGRVALIGHFVSQVLRRVWSDSIKC